MGRSRDPRSPSTQPPSSGLFQFRRVPNAVCGWRSATGHRFSLCKAEESSDCLVNMYGRGIMGCFPESSQAKQPADQHLELLLASLPGNTFCLLNILVKHLLQSGFQTSSPGYNVSKMCGLTLTELQTSGEVSLQHRGSWSKHRSQMMVKTSRACLPRDLNPHFCSRAPMRNLGHQAPQINAKGLLPSGRGHQGPRTGRKGRSQTFLVSQVFPKVVRNNNLLPEPKKGTWDDRL